MKVKKSDSNLYDLIYEKELVLANRMTRDVSKYIAKDFVEFGSSGRIITYHMQIEYFKNCSEKKTIITDFNIKMLGAAHVQATYITDIDGKKTRRSSLWRFKDGVWKLFFHQGTPIS